MTRKVKNQFFLFDRPMVADGRENALLGVAFEDPRLGTLGRFAPQGPQLDANKPTTTTNTSTVSSDTPTNDPTTGVVAKDDVTEEVTSYRTPGPWPKDLLSGLYPNKATPAIGVEAITNSIHDADMKARIVSAISFGLHVKSSDLDKLVIPEVRRHSIEDPPGKIEGLLGIPAYRKRLIKLFEEQKDHSKKKLFIATNLMACGHASRSREQQQDKGFLAKIKDPTKHVPADLEAHANSTKTEKGKQEYPEDVILCMSYRRVWYECVPDDHRGLLSWIFGGKAQRPHDKYAIKFDREDPKDTSKDVFWIEKEDAKGEIPPMMGNRRDTDRDVGVDPGTDAVAGAEQGIFGDFGVYDSDLDDLSDDEWPADYLKIFGAEETPKTVTEH